MTKEQALEAAKILTAYAEGKDIEIKYGGDIAWYSCDDPDFSFGECQYRVKPENKKIPLDESDMTPTTWIMWIKEKFPCKVIAFGHEGVCIGRANGNIDTINYKSMIDACWEISTTPDRFEWRPAWKEQTN